MDVVSLENNLHVSPYLTMNPTVISYGKRIEIKIVDSLLKPNTTYKISLGNALVDNREQTPIKDFTYIFSTGSYFDSLKLNGKIFANETGQVDTGLHVLLYDADITDSAILFTKPTYITKTRGDGSFTLDLLPEKEFKIIAIKDEDKNLLYSGGNERIAFLNHTVSTVTHKDSIITLQSFLAASKDTTTTQTTPKSTQADRFANKSKVKTDEPYTIAIDTNIKNRTFGLIDTLKINTQVYLKKVDQNKVYLSYDNNGVEVEALYTLKTDSTGVWIDSDWQQDKVYTLRLIKGWATDVEDKEVLPNKVSFRTKSKDDYSNLIVNIDSTFHKENFLVTVKSENATIFLGKANLAKIELPLLKPGTYTISIIDDSNNDGQWTTGDFLLQRQPEVMHHHFSPILLRAGWDNEVDFKAANINDPAKLQDDKIKNRN